MKNTALTIQMFIKTVSSICHVSSDQSPKHTCAFSTKTSHTVNSKSRGTEPSVTGRVARPGAAAVFQLLYSSH